MENQESQKSEQKKRLTREDCKLDRKHFHDKDEQGNEVIEEIDDESLEDWKIEDVGCDVDDRATEEKCRDYYFYDYDKDLLAEYYHQRGQDFNPTEWKYARWGLIKMFNDNWLKSPAFVDWSAMRNCIREDHIEDFIHNIKSAATRVQILEHIIKIVDSICQGSFVRSSWDKKDVLPIYKRLKAESEAAAKVEKQELAKQKAAEKKQEKKKNSDFVVTIDEIMNYANHEAGEHQYAIAAMLRYFCFQKQEWDNSIVRNKIRSLGSKTEISIENNGTLNQNVNSDVSIHQ